MKIQTLLLTIALSVSPVVRAEDCPLCIPAIMDDVPEIQRLIRYGADINSTSFDMTALSTAITMGSVNAVEALIEAGVVLNRMDEQGDTPLGMATAQFNLVGGSDRQKIVELLTKAGALCINNNAICE